MAEANVRKSGRPRKSTSYLEDDIKYDYMMDVDFSENGIAEKQNKRKKSREKSPKQSKLHPNTEDNLNVAALPPDDDGSNHTVDYYPSGVDDGTENTKDNMVDESPNHPTSESTPKNAKSKKNLIAMPRSGGFTCEICEKVCVDLASFKRHMKGHSSDRKFQCAICSKAFIDSCSLKRHMKIHDDERPFTCDLCFKSFRDGPSLTRHQQTHMDRPRTFTCQTCGKGFTDKHGLTRHERTHTGLRPFECEICGKTFSESGSFKRHQKTHIGIRRFSCIACGKRFLEKQSLLRHQRIVCGIAEDTTKTNPNANIVVDLDSSTVSNVSLDNGNSDSNTSLKSIKESSSTLVQQTPRKKQRGDSNKEMRNSQEEPSLQSLMKKDPNLYAGISDLVESIDSYEQMLDLCGDNGHSQIEAALTRDPEPMPDNLLCFECGEHLVDGENFCKAGKTFRLPLKNQFKCLNCEDEDLGDYRESSVLSVDPNVPSGDGETSGQAPNNPEIFSNGDTDINRAGNTTGNNHEPDLSSRSEDIPKEDTPPVSFPNDANTVPGTEESLEHFRERLRNQHGVYFLGEMYPHLLSSMPATQEDTDSTTATSTNASVSRSSSTEDTDLYGQDLEPTVTFQEPNTSAMNAESIPQPSERESSTKDSPTPDECLKNAHHQNMVTESTVASACTPSVPQPSYAADEPIIPSVFPCHLCTKVFATPAFLARHLYLHKNSPHKCMICSKTFTNAMSLRRHITTHTGEKPYACPKCSKRFRDPSNFSKHKKICTAIPPIETPAVAGSSPSPATPVPPLAPAKSRKTKRQKGQVLGETARDETSVADQRQPSQDSVNQKALPEVRFSYDVDMAYDARSRYDVDASYNTNNSYGVDADSVADDNCDIVARYNADSHNNYGADTGSIVDENGDVDAGYTADYNYGADAGDIDAKFNADNINSGFDANSDVDDDDADLPVSFGEPLQQCSPQALDHIYDGEDNGDSLHMSDAGPFGDYSSFSDVPQADGKDLEMAVFCGICERSFMKEKDLQRHMRFHSSENPELTCEECGKSFKDSSNLKRHVRIHADTRPFVCEFCHRGYCDNWSLRKHQSRGCLVSELKVPASVMVPCPQCHRVFATPELQAEHIASVHKGALKFECDICLKRFSEAFNLKRHRRLHMAVCPGCEREFKDVKLLAEHQKTECPAARVTADSGISIKENNFPCPECGRVYTTKANLERHKKFHSALKPFACEICQKRFSEAFKLKRHMKVHSESKPYVCPNCNKGFSYAQGLRQHLLKTRCLKNPLNSATPVSTTAPLRQLQSASAPEAASQTPPKPSIKSPTSSSSGYPCELCGKTFLKKFLLVRHMNVHSAQRPYICGQCGKAYKDSSSLKRHCLVHRGVKEFVCHDCGKAFFYADSLRRHRNGLCGRTTQAESQLALSKTSPTRRQGRKRKLNHTSDVFNNNNNNNSNDPTSLTEDTSGTPVQEDTKGQTPEESRESSQEVEELGLPDNTSSANQVSTNQKEPETMSAHMLPRCPIRLPRKPIPTGPWSCTKGVYCWRCGVYFPSNSALLEHLVVHRHKKPYCSRRSYHRWARKCYLASELRTERGPVKKFTAIQPEVDTPGLKIRLKLLSHKPESESEGHCLDTEVGDIEDSNPRPKRSVARARWSWISQIQ
ncbi:zinc finger protein 665 [Elysia marginata]|uniref:Zinc finger protein 865 n=1 Tax=Elysia marginata TaxID=1093978 RepID=A0AAV4JF74_9GAST|nr:zinc finger protein 665 [Elysia marginata]